MLRIARGPLGWALAAVVLLAACSGGGGTTTVASGTPKPSGPRLGSFDRPIVLGFTPSQETAQIKASASAIASALATATGLRWKVTIPTSYAAQIEAMCAGQEDVAFFAPLQMTLLLDKSCGEPVISALRKDETGKLATTYNSQILVRTDSGITDLAGLKGKKFAFVDAISASGYVFPTLTIKQKTGQEPKTFFASTIFAGGHPQAALALYNGQVDGAATFSDVRTSPGMPADIMAKTKVISSAGPIPNDGIALAKGFPVDIGKQVVKALLDYSQTDQGKKDFSLLFQWDGAQTVDRAFYDPMREAAKLAGVDVQGLANQTPRPPATPSPSPTKTP